MTISNQFKSETTKEYDKALTALDSIDINSPEYGKQQKYIEQLLVKIRREANEEEAHRLLRADRARWSRIQMGKEIIEALQFLHGDDYDKKFNEMRSAGLTVEQIHDKLGRELAGE
jgi:hypothetical protein